MQNEVTDLKLLGYLLGRNACRFSSSIPQFLGDRLE